MENFSRIPGPSALWRVSKGGKLRGFLFGTVHLGIGPGELRDDVFEAFAESERLFYEVDTRFGVMPAVFLGYAIARVLKLPKGQKVSRVLSPVEWRRLCRLLHPLRPWMLTKLRPWCLIGLIIKRQTHHEKTPSMDGAILDGAYSRRMRVDYFEEEKLQINLLTEAVATVGFDDLREAIADPWGYTREARKVIDCYAIGDFEGVMRDAQNAPDFLKFFIRRNEAWLPIIIEALSGAEGLPFVSGGCGHFLGENGVVDLLETEGFDCRLANESET